MSRVSIVGAGYVGLVSGVCLAEKGHNVVCVDVDQSKLEAILAKRQPFHEAGLTELLEKHVGNRFSAHDDLRRAVRESEITLIAVGTPFDGDRIDLTYVRTVAREIGEALRDKDDFHLVVVKSTVVPGTTEKVVLPILEQASGKCAGGGFGVGMNPEFLTEGVAVRDFMQPDRIVLGALDDRSHAMLDALYAAFPDTPKIRTNPRTAEMIKYASNSVLATLISFSNEFANLCTALGGIDVADVTRGVHLAHYFRCDDGGEVRTAPITSFLEAGCGFGGSCLPKDVNALISHGRDAGEQMPLLNSVMEINRGQPDRMVAILRRHFDELSDLRVTVLGLAFKPDTDDMRQSPAIPIIERLLDAGAAVTAFDPVALEAARRVLPDRGIRYADSLTDSLQDAQAILLVTRWDHFRALGSMLLERPESPLVVDGRRMLNPTDFARYDGIGR